MGDTVYRVGELALSARERQPAGAPKGIVLALHGGGYGAGYWDFSPTSLLDVAAARGHLGVAIDRPGYGAAFARPMPLAEQATVVLDLAEQLRAQIGKASGRERVWQYVLISVVAGSLTKKNQK